MAAVPQPTGGGGFPVVPLAQTLVDLLDVLSLDDVRLVTADAVHRGGIQRSALTLDVRVPRRNAGRWRWIVVEIMAGAASGGEARYWRAVRQSGLPLPELNAVVELDAGVAVVDALWRRYRLSVEIDGYASTGDLPRSRSTECDRTGCVWEVSC